MSRRASRRVRSFRPRAEVLEDRLVLTTTQFVSSVFLDLMRRQPDAAELASGVNAINTGLSPQQYAANLLNTQEYLTNQIYNDYGAYLGRLPTSGDVAFWLGQRAAGLTTQEEAALILGSQEAFLRASNSNAGWLNVAYSDVLGRTPDGIGLNGWLAALAAGTSRATVASSLITSLEGDARVAGAGYERMLQRNLDQSGASFWTAQLEAGLTPTQFLADLAGSPEFIAGQAGGSLDNGPVTTLPVGTPGGIAPASQGAQFLPSFNYSPLFATAAQFGEQFRTSPGAANVFLGSAGG